MEGVFFGHFHASVCGSNPGGASNLRSDFRRRLSTGARAFGEREGGPQPPIESFGWQANFSMFSTISISSSIAIHEYGHVIPARRRPT